MFITYIINDQTSFIFMILIVALINTPRVLFEFFLILTGCSASTCTFCVIMRIYTIVFDALMRFLQIIILTSSTDDEGSQGVGLFFSLFYVFFLIFVDIYFTYIFNYLKRRDEE